MSKLQPLERSGSLTDMARSSLKDALISGVFTPGQKLSYRTYADALGISVTPMREAISQLVAEGALVSGHYQSVYVPQLTTDKVREIQRIRMLLEGLAAEVATPNITADMVATLESLQLEMAAAIDRRDIKEALRKNKEFHFGIYGASRMKTLTRMIETLWVQIGPSVNLLHPAPKKGHTGIRNHRRALDGIRAQDEKIVRLAIEQDIMDGAERLILALSTRHDSSHTP